MAADYNRAYKAEYKGTTTGGAYKINNKTRSSRAYKVVVGGPSNCTRLTTTNLEQKQKSKRASETREWASAWAQNYQQLARAHHTTTHLHDFEIRAS